ncbi:CU044_2847 family protein [Streptomyces sp. NPDC093085]|uniref:CU044_2847 family protein n=1 Tax=Streptomyces sp. NPDC093085 TaxID=3155068 RepID=UPI0034411D3F
MGDGEASVTRIEMPDGTPVWARISGAEELTRPAGGGLRYSDIGFADQVADQVQARVESLQAVVTSVARSLVGPLRAVRPDEVSVEFGIELTAKAGKVVGLLADGEANGGIKVTLTWTGGGPPADLTAPPQAVPPARTAGDDGSGGAGAAGAAGDGRGSAGDGGGSAGGASTGAPAHPGGSTPPAGGGA